MKQKDIYRQKTRLAQERVMAVCGSTHRLVPSQFFLDLLKTKEAASFSSLLEVTTIDHYVCYSLPDTNLTFIRAFN